MARSKNKQALVSAFLRFGRAAVAAILALIVPALLDLIPQLELGAEFKAASVAILMPGLLALDKYLRVKGAY